MILDILKSVYKGLDGIVIVLKFLAELLAIVWNFFFYQPTTGTKVLSVFINPLVELLVGVLVKLKVLSGFINPLVELLVGIYQPGHHTWQRIYVFRERLHKPSSTNKWPQWLSTGWLPSTLQGAGALRTRNKIANSGKTGASAKMTEGILRVMCLWQAFVTMPGRRTYTASRLAGIVCSPGKNICLWMEWPERY